MTALATSTQRNVPAKSHGRRMMEQADHGRPFPAALRQSALARRALRTGWDEPVLMPPRQWELPAGAFGNTAGPT